MYTNLQCSSFSLFLHHHFYFFLRLLYHLFDSGRMNTSVHNQFFQRNSCNFTTNRVKTGQNNCLRRIIDNQVYTRHCFQCTDISSFPSDDSSFHFIVWKLYNGNSCFRNMVCCTSLNCGYNILLCLFVCFLFGPTFHFFNHHGRFMLYFIFNNFQ